MYLLFSFLWINFEMCYCLPEKRYWIKIQTFYHKCYVIHVYDTTVKCNIDQCYAFQYNILIYNTSLFCYFVRNFSEVIDNLYA